MWTTSILLGSLLPLVSAIGGKQCLTFNTDNDPFVIADHGSLVPIITDSSDSASIHLAAATFADDLERVTGSRPGVYNDTVPDWAQRVVMVGTVSSGLLAGLDKRGLEGQWEAYNIRVVDSPVDGVESALVITGSDKVCRSEDLSRRC
jgi:hypothetical protein